MPLKVEAPRAAVERYVRDLATRLDRAPVDSRLLLRDGRPFVTRSASAGRLPQIVAGRKAIVFALKTHARDPIRFGSHAGAGRSRRASRSAT